MVVAYFCGLLILSMAKILLIETSSEVCSAAISVDGVVVAFSEQLEVKSHAALLTIQISECCETAGITLAQLDAVAISHGPGAYTALRVGASVAKGICYALEKPLIGLDTLRVLAHASIEQQVSIRERQVSGPKWSVQTMVFVPMLDARRQEVWLAVYDAGLREIASAQPLILENNSFENFVDGKVPEIGMNGIVLGGNGMEKMRSGHFLKNVVFGEIKKCSARYLATLAEQSFQQADFQDVAYFEPYYMKPPNITTPNKPLF